MRIVILSLVALFALAGCKSVSEPTAPEGTPEFVEQQRTICEARGGSWGSGEDRATNICFLTPKDANEPCTQASDCEGQCLARSRTCAPVMPLLGCHDVFMSGRIAGDGLPELIRTVEPWVAATLAAVAFQTVRFALQKRLKTAGLSATGATWARFLWTAPMLTVALAGWHWGAGGALPPLSLAFWIWGIAGGVAQILATICVVLLFARRNFAIGITFKKSEVLLTALIGWLLLGEAVSAAGLMALVLGAIALLVLSPGARSGFE